MAFKWGTNDITSVKWKSSDNATAQDVTTVIYRDSNGDHEVWTSSRLTTITGSVSFYENDDYPIQLNWRNDQAIGNTGYDAYSPAKKVGGVIVFDFTNIDSSLIDTSKNATITLHFTASTYLSEILKSDFNAITPKYGSNEKRNATKWASFFGMTNQAHGGTISGNDLVITVTGSALQSAASNTLTVSSTEKLLTFGVLHRSNVPRLCDNSNHPTISFYYKG